MFSSIKNSHHVPLLVTVCLVLFFLDLGGRDIWDIDEGMHAAIAQTMINTGDWVTPVFNGEPFFDKPPLFNWATAISFLIVGFTEFAARLPAALAGLGCVLLTFSLARKMFDSSTGLAAGLVLASSLEFMLLSRVVQYDIPFTFFTTLAVYCYAFGIMEPARQKLFFTGVYVAAALAVLVKGPIGFIIPGVAIGGHLLISQRLELLRGLLSIPGILAFCVIVVPWFVLMEQANSGYLDYFIMKQHLGNFIGGAGALSPRHPEPIYYYLPVLIGGLLPWSITLPQAIKRALTSDRLAAQGLSVFLVVWAAGVFIFFSAATSKLSTYLLPIFPAVAILLGRYWHELALQKDGSLQRGVFISFVILSAILLLFTGYAMIERPWTYWKFRTGIEWADFELFLVVFTVLIGLVGALVWLKKIRSGFVALALTSPILVFYITWVLVPGSDPYKGGREIGIALNERLPDGEKLRFHGQMLDSAMFYTDRDAVMLHSAESFNEYLASDDRVYVLVRTRARRKEDAFQGDYYIIETIGNKAIVSNQPD